MNLSNFSTRSNIGSARKPLSVLLASIMLIAASNASATDTATKTPTATQTTQATGTNTMQQAQQEKQIENAVKAFAYAWYSRFDKGTNMDELRPYLPDETVEFVYPSVTLKSMEELSAYAKKAFPRVKTSAHNFGEIAVYRTGDNTFEVITPHTYHVQGADDSLMQMDFVGRMKLTSGLKTKADPNGENIKVTAYKVALQNKPQATTLDNITATKQGNFTVNDAKSFVHQWFSLIDAGDADALMTMTSDKPLNIDILGNKVADKAALKGFLEAQKANQNSSVHTPTHINVQKNDAGGFNVSFVLNFAGDIKKMGAMHLSNITQWTLVAEDGKLKLRDYTLNIL